MVRVGAARNLPQIHTSKCCVAYLDVLGASEFMKKNDDKLSFTLKFRKIE